MTGLSDVRAARWLNEFNALDEAARASREQVVAFERLRGITADTYGRMNREARAAYDVARLDNLAKVAALDAFINNKADDLMREASVHEAVMRDPRRSVWEQNEASQLHENALANYQAFLDARRTQEWKASEPVSYQIGERRITSFRGTVREEDSPTGLVAATGKYFRDSGRALAAGVGQVLDTAHRGLVEITTFEECVAALGLVKGSVLGLMFPPSVTGGRIGTELFNHGLGESIKPEDDFCRFIYRPQDWRELIRLHGDAGLEADFDAVAAAGLLPTAFTIPQEVFSQIVAYQSVLDDVMHMNSLDELDARLADALVAAAGFDGSRQVFADGLSATMMASLENMCFSPTRVDDVRWLLQRQDGDSQVNVDVTLDLLAPSDATGGLSVSGLRITNAEGATAELSADALAAFGIDIENVTSGAYPDGAQSFIEGLHLSASGASGWRTPTPTEASIAPGAECSRRARCTRRIRRAMTSLAN